MAKYKTGQKVPKDGTYICEAGQKHTYRTNELFNPCPITEKRTSWREIE